MNVLSDIQKKLKVGKGNRNEFGKYNYRNCSDILEAVKPLLPNGWYVTLSDELTMIGERYYVCATATLAGNEKENCYSATAYARESFDKKGMDDSQITGAASSYARKYALNGLFAIDDTDDADSKDNRDHSTKKDSDVAMMAEYNALVDKFADTIVVVKESIKSGDLESAANAWYELDEADQLALWKAPSKGGCFTTAERNAFREFSQFKRK